MKIEDGAGMLKDHFIGERRVLAVDGELPRRLTVFCETRGDAVLVAECEGCARCATVRLPEPGDAGAVRCVQMMNDVEPTDLGLRAPVSAVMTRSVMLVTDAVSAESAAALLLTRAMSATAVVDARGRLVGMVSKTDLLRALHEAGGALDVSRTENDALDPALNSVRAIGPSVAEVMTPMVYAVPGGTELSRAAALMVSEGIHQLPVLADDGSVDGILTSIDVMAWVARLDGYPVAGRELPTRPRGAGG